MSNRSACVPTNATLPPTRAARNISISNKKITFFNKKMLLLGKIPHFNPL